eukprot:g66957.t1
MRQGDDSRRSEERRPKVSRPLSHLSTRLACTPPPVLPPKPGERTENKERNALPDPVTVTIYELESHTQPTVTTPDAASTLHSVLTPGLRHNLTPSTSQGQRTSLFPESADSSSKFPWKRKYLCLRLGSAGKCNAQTI